MHGHTDAVLLAGGNNNGVNGMTGGAGGVAMGGGGAGGGPGGGFGMGMANVNDDWDDGGAGLPDEPGSEGE